MGKYQNKRLGQVFLHDGNIIRKILGAASINSAEHLIEIGCGDGILTKELSNTGKPLTVIELDQHYLEKVQALVPDTVSFIHQDALKVDFQALPPHPITMIANIPYQISSPLMERLIRDRSVIKECTLMVQNEFAKRICGQPKTKDYGSLSVYAQFYLDIEICFPVSRNCFYPVPKVDSAVIKLSPKAKPLYDVDETKFFSMVRSGFWGRRKPFLSCLKKSPYLDLPKGFSPGPFLQEHGHRRAETLTTEEFYMAYLEISND
ncbi:ribosomal RNA small subunit methyltransferase A [bacterium]|jgi:16S rRNA (adenine1518-N6/adenine1519-N6)-dimethyltransferase|nr:ribosomal RNA small subunit methyltransferase A [bacterium]